MSFLVIPKSPKVGKNVEKIRLGSSKLIEEVNQYNYLVYVWVKVFKISCSYILQVLNKQIQKAQIETLLQKFAAQALIG